MEAALVVDRSVESREVYSVGHTIPHYIDGRIKETYSILLTRESQFNGYDHPSVSMDFLVAKDSKEPWRKQSAYLDWSLCQHYEEIKPLLSDYHIHLHSYYSPSTESRCKSAVESLGFWIEDRVEHELSLMRAEYKERLNELQAAGLV